MNPLPDAHYRKIEAALWKALRVHDEDGSPPRRLAVRARELRLIAPRALAVVRSREYEGNPWPTSILHLSSRRCSST